MKPNPVLQHIRRAALLRDGGGLNDGQLLERFLVGRDEDAFAGLLKRHGPMVLAVCRRVLGDEHDAEDACQATFLILARKAGAVRCSTALGSWLHGVAYRTAFRARNMRARQRARERRAGARTLDEHFRQEDLDEVLQLLDHELHSLPEKYRVPVVLCELEGRSRKEVAGQLRLQEGTLSSRLAYAKKLLAKRLSRRGAALSAGAVALVLAQGAASASLPSSLLTATAKAAASRTFAAGAISVQVATLVEGVLKAMLLSKLTVFGAVVAVVIGVGAVGLTYRPASAQPAPEGPSARRAVADELEELRLEVAALRKGLEAARVRIKALEDERRPLKATTRQPASSRPENLIGPSNTNILWDERLQQEGLLDPSNVPWDGQSPEQYAAWLRTRHELQHDPLAEAWSALSQLQQHPDDKKAAEALEQAVRRLKERAKPKTAANNSQ
jgi:RNA polymerase sigma factor (sigma-70 family)